MQKEGKHVGLRNVNREELEAGLQLGPIATVENTYGYARRTSLSAPCGETRGGEEVLSVCKAHGLPLIPFFVLAPGLPKAGDKLATLAWQKGVTETQLNIAWLLHRLPWLLPIPGTSSRAHLRENLRAAEIQLSAEDMAYLRQRAA